MTARRSATVELPEGTIRYDVAGTEGPPVVLLHGGGMDNARLTWRHVLPALAEHHVVHAPDWPKHGGSWPWHGAADQRGLEDCLEGLLDHWDLPSASLVGLSMGGAAALGFTLRHPSRVDRLVLVDSGGLQRRVRAHLLSYLAVQGPAPRLMRAALTRRAVSWSIRHATFAAPVAEIPDADEIAAEVHDELRAKRDGSPYSDWQRREIGPRSMRTDFTARLHEIAVPTLLVHGTADDLVPVAHARAAAERIHGAELRLLEGCGHWSPRERPHEVIAALLDFLRR